MTTCTVTKTEILGKYRTKGVCFKQINKIHFNRLEINNLLAQDFKIIVIKMLTKVRRSFINKVRIQERIKQKLHI